MNVLILGANGQLGPHVIKALEKDGHTLRLTDVNDPPDTSHEYFNLDASNLDGVIAAAEGMDTIVNLSVLRPDRQIAFDVNASGAYNAMAAAVHHGIRRVINTGPHFTIAGPTYENSDHLIGPDIPTQSGTLLYAITKSLGQEVCRIFTENHDVHVLTLLFYNFWYPDDHSADGQDVTPFSVTWEDSAEAFRPALSIDLDDLPSKCEIFFIFADMPHQKFTNEKAKRILGWHPTNTLSHRWTKL
ncbi:MAG: NAD(P)-dependent oxidoreductase [Chloroflexi bacterium]|nr:NAD(P)-dependent oxidoreductase [Chloroflexota bacterium]